MQPDVLDAIVGMRCILQHNLFQIYHSRFHPQAHLENITFADVKEDDLRPYSDQCFLNLFRLSQLLLEYLLSVQDTLATSLEVPKPMMTSAGSFCDLDSQGSILCRPCQNQLSIHVKV